MTYLRVKHSSKVKPEDQSEFWLLVNVMLALSASGIVYVTAAIVILGLVFNFPAFSFLSGKLTPSIPPPIMYTSFLVSFLIFYIACVKGRKYRAYPERYPDISVKNIRQNDQRYLLTPAVLSLIVLFASTYMVFHFERGI